MLAACLPRTSAAVLEFRMRLVRAATIAWLAVAGVAESQDRSSDPEKAVELYEALREGTARFEFEPKPFVLDAAEDPRFRPGQVWRYRTRPGEERSRLIVCRTDSGPQFGTFVHVQVEGVELRNPVGSKLSTTVDHVPLAREALDPSVTEIQRTDGTCKNFGVAYEKWRREFLSPRGRAGVFTASVAETIELLDKASGAGNGQSSE